MGWKEGDELTYEITDEDKEEYEKRIQLSPKVIISLSDVHYTSNSLRFITKMMFIRSL